MGMTLRITYCEEASTDTAVSGDVVNAPSVPIYGPGPAYAEWDDSRPTALLLYLADEPEIGHRFQYGGATWEIIDYHDGWIAQLVV